MISFCQGWFLKLKVRTFLIVTKTLGSALGYPMFRNSQNPLKGLGFRDLGFRDFDLGFRV